MSTTTSKSIRVSWNIMKRDTQYTGFKSRVLASAHQSFGGERGEVCTKGQRGGQNIVLRPRDALLQCNVHQLQLLQHLTTSSSCIRTCVGLIHASYHLFWCSESTGEEEEEIQNRSRRDKDGASAAVTLWLRVERRSNNSM